MVNLIYTVIKCASVKKPYSFFVVVLYIKKNKKKLHVVCRTPVCGGDEKKMKEKNVNELEIISKKKKGSKVVQSPYMYVKNKKRYNLHKSSVG